MALGNLVGTMVYPDGTAFTGTLTLRLNGPAKDSAGNLVMPAYQNYAIGTTGVVDIQIDDTESLTSIASTQVLYEMMLDDDGTPFRIGDIKMGTGTTYLADAWINALDAPHSGLLCYVPFNNMVNKYPRRTGNDIGTFSSAMSYGTAKLNQGIKFLGKRDNSSGDALSFIRGAQISGNNYANFNTNHGSISFWLYRMGGDTGVAGTILEALFPYFFVRNTNNTMDVNFASGKTITVSNINTNTWYHIVIRWNVNNTIDGTNYACVSVNDTHTFGVTSNWTPVTPQATLIMGRYTTADNEYSRCIVDDFAIFDRVLGDGTYPTGITDEIAAIYNSGTGAEAGLAGDPSLRAYFKLDGSGNLTSGTNAGMGCSFPWAAGLITDGNMETAGTASYAINNGTLAKVGTAAGTNHLYDTQSMRLISNAGQVGAMDQAITPGSAANYLISFWAKNLRAAAFSFLGLAGTGANETSWTRYEMAVQATSANQGTLEVVGSQGGTAYIDNIWLGTSLLSNGGFELAWPGGTLPEGWTRVGECIGTRVSNAGHGGLDHFRIQSGDNSGTHYQQQLSNLTNNKWYLFVGYLLTGSGTCNIDLSGGATTTLTGTQTIWTRKAHIFKSTGTLLNVRCYANSGGTANYDDFAVIGMTDIDVTASPAAVGSSYDTGKWGTALGALRINGGDSFSIPGTTTIGSNISHGTGAISCWVYPEGWNPSNNATLIYTIFDIGQNATTNRVSVYTTGESGTNLRFLIYGNTASAYKTIDYNIGTANFGSNAWHHILASWTAAGPDSLWLNGTSVGTTGSSGVWSNLASLAAGNNLFIGGDISSSSASQFDGLIDDVRIYDAIPSNANKTAIYNDNEYLGQS